MSEPNSSTYQYLLANYGPLLTLKHVAEVMHTTPNGVRMAITRKRQPFAAALAEARRTLGRRVYFEARRVADVIDQDLASPTSPHYPGAAAEGLAVGTRPVCSDGDAACSL